MRKKAAARPGVSSTGNAASAAATTPSSSATVTTSRLALLPGSANARWSTCRARAGPPAKRSYMPPALWYSRSATAAPSVRRAGRTAGADPPSDKVHRGQRLADSTVEGRGHPAELALGFVGARDGVPEEEVQLPAGQERRPPDDSRHELARARHRACHRYRHGGGHPPATGGVHHCLRKLADGHMLVAEDVALA